MSNDQLHDDFLNDIRNLLSDWVRTEDHLAQAHDGKRTAHERLMAGVHQARCAGVRWRSIAFAACRAWNLPVAAAVKVAPSLRKQLTRYLHEQGLTSCHQQVRRRTTVVEELIDTGVAASGGPIDEPPPRRAPRRRR